MPSFPVKRRVFGLDIYFDSRDHPFVWYAQRGALEEHENIPVVLEKGRGLFWDVGANAGLYTLRAASLGMRVVSFDISPKAISYIRRSAERNGLASRVTTVPRAFSVETIKYQPPTTAVADNSLVAGEKKMTSITYVEAAAQYGVPNLIKMDIEGYEEVFLRSKEFKRWLLDNKIGWIVEVHKPEYWDLLWKDVKMTRLSVGVVFFEPDGYLVK